ncbi:hypothetical protein M885DRAFT_486811 [Pelagophyceae sp. CCMP2097]|nr:hypothetical protein M885DRAFT_486811 [Pelagophyceae sp. CCMP2097]
MFSPAAAPLACAEVAQVSRINAACLHVGVGALLTYSVTVAATFWWFAESREYLLPRERGAAGLAASALTASLVLRGITWLTSEIVNRSSPDDESKRAPATPGVVWLAHCVNLVAACTSWLFFLVPVPVVWDPITHCRVHMLRWCEWVVLSFTMTFMTEVADRSDPWSAVRLGATQSVSTACGFLLPLARGPNEWAAIMTLSMVLYVALFPRLCKRRASVRGARARRDAARGTLHYPDAADEASRVEMSYMLLTCCCTIWTTFVLVYGLAGFAKWSGLDTTPAPAWPFVCDVFADLLAKFVYAAVIVDAHAALFDEGAMGARRMRELHGLVSAVWASSSDTLAISVRHRLADGRVRVETAVSHDDAQGPPACAAQHAAWSGGGAAVEATSVVYEEPATSVVYEEDGEPRPAAAAEACFAGLIRRAWLVEAAPLAERNFRLTHELARADGTTFQTEASVTRLGPDRMVVVVRDITERDARHEAEKVLVKQAAAHERDAAANRFTRHEVKNGLLAAIGLADALLELRAPTAGGYARLPDARTAGGDSAASVVADLQTALTDTLNTVLSETMARELVYDTYVAAPETVDIADVCRGHGGYHNAVKNLKNGGRFRLEVWPANLPCLVLDPQLLHCIHRNAVSNACKYGAADGEVTTRLRLVDPADGTAVSAAAVATRSSGTFTLTLEVVNEPGADHGRLVALDGAAAEARVFAQGVRLHAELHCRGAAAAAALSSGDGGWIMRKCARALGGDCGISFTAEGSFFTASFPATVAVQPVTLPRCPSDAGGFAALGDAPPFALPAGTWGIGIDDSGMQRKLLVKLLVFAGVAEDRVFVTGETADEIDSFAAFVVEHVRQHAQDYHLVVVDENLDVKRTGPGKTVLGSEIILELRATLEAEGLNGRLLTVVRSANDSPEDVAVNRSRAHGFLPKAPVRRDKVLEVLAPIWAGRFPEAPRADGGAAADAKLHASVRQVCAAAPTRECAAAPEEPQHHGRAPPADAAEESGAAEARDPAGSPESESNQEAVCRALGALNIASSSLVPAFADAALHRAAPAGELS